MAPTNKLQSVAWIFYLLIVFEIIYMITPFLALSYYSFYGPSLNFLHQWAATAWLTAFFLPHIAETDSPFINSLNTVGRAIFFIALAAFLVGAAQIYYSKFTKQGAVIRGLYKYIRHPQYSAFALMSLGIILVWPRFVILAMYMFVLFIYYFLAKREEKECLEKYGDEYKEYHSGTSMFFPGDSFLWKNFEKFIAPKKGNFWSIAATIAVTLFLAIVLAFAMRNYVIRHISTYSTEEQATISLTLMPVERIKIILDLALGDQRVQKRLMSTNDHTNQKLLTFISPDSWFTADLPLEPYEEGKGGHYQPVDYDTGKYKILFTEAAFHGEASGLEIIKRTFRRMPLLVVHVDIEKGKVLRIINPPEHVVWGDIPTPIF